MDWGREVLQYNTAPAWRIMSTKAEFEDAGGLERKDTYPIVDCMPSTLNES